MESHKVYTSGSWELYRQLLTKTPEPPPGDGWEPIGGSSDHLYWRRPVPASSVDLTTQEVRAQVYSSATQTAMSIGWPYDPEPPNHATLPLTSLQDMVRHLSEQTATILSLREYLRQSDQARSALEEALKEATQNLSGLTEPELVRRYWAAIDGHKTAASHHDWVAWESELGRIRQELARRQLFVPHDSERGRAQDYSHITPSPAPPVSGSYPFPEPGTPNDGPRCRRCGRLTSRTEGGRRCLHCEAADACAPSPDALAQTIDPDPRPRVADVDRVEDLRRRLFDHNPPGAPPQQVAARTLDEIRERLRQVAPAPWTIEPHGPDGGLTLYSQRDDHRHGLNLVSFHAWDWNQAAMVAFLQEAPADIAWLLTEIQRLHELETRHQSAQERLQERAKAQMDLQTDLLEADRKVARLEEQVAELTRERDALMRLMPDPSQPSYALPGVDLILEERLEQIRVHGYDAAHDDEHQDNELAWVGAYLAAPRVGWIPDGSVPDWGHVIRRDTPDLSHRLAKAGAFIAAELDRLWRAEHGDPNAHLTQAGPGEWEPLAEAKEPPTASGYDPATGRFTIVSPAPVPDPEPESPAPSTFLRRHEWETFREAGMLGVANMLLHLFGWALTVEVDDAQVVRAYPARTTFRGFDADTSAEIFTKAHRWLAANAETLRRETEGEPS